MEEEKKTEEVVAEEVKEETTTEEVTETPVVEQPVVEEPVSDPVPVKPIKRSKKDIIGYNPETGEPIYKEIVPGEMPVKKSKKGLVIGIILALVIIVGVVVAIILLGGKKEEKELTSHEYRQIVKKYGTSAEKAITKYKNKKDKLPEFKDIEKDIAYDEYKVSCDTIKINYDGTIYLAKCSVNGKELKKTITYGEEKEEPVVIKNSIYFYKENGKLKSAYKKDNLKDSDIVATYECSEDTTCNLYEVEGFIPGIMSNDMAFIMERKSSDYKVMLYDIDAKKVVGTYASAAWLYDGEDYSSTDGKYILVKKYNSDLYGIIDKDGKLIHDYTIGRKINSGVGGSKLYQSIYSIADDYFVTYKDGKFGITKLTSNDTVIDAKYDDIKLIDKNNFKALEDGKWYLYSYETKEKVLPDGYDFIVGVYGNLVVVSQDKKVLALDFDGNNMAEEDIEDNTKELYDAKEVCCGNNPGISVKYNSDYTITITVYKDNNSSDKKEYTVKTHNGEIDYSI